MGVIFGVIFGIIDVEDYYNGKNKVVFYVVLQQEISLCEPIGAIFGGFTGFMMEFLRQQEMIQREEQPINGQGEEIDSSDDEKESERPAKQGEPQIMHIRGSASTSSKSS